MSVTGCPGRMCVELRLLEVRRDPDVVRHEHRQVRAGLRELADCGGELDDAARLVCRNGRIGKVQLRLVALGFGLREARDGAVALRLQRLDLPLRQFEGRLRTVQCGLLLMQLRSVLLGVLNGARDCVVPGIGSAPPAAARTPAPPAPVSTCAWSALIWACCTLDLRIDVLDVGLRGRHLRLGLGERGAVIAIVDAGDHVAGCDVLIVGDRNGRDVARHLGGDGELPRRDVGVVGRLEMAGVVPVEISGRQRQRKNSKPKATAIGCRRSQLLRASPPVSRFCGSTSSSVCAARREAVPGVPGSDGGTCSSGAGRYGLPFPRADAGSDRGASSSAWSPFSRPSRSDMIAPPANAED